MYEWEEVLTQILSGSIGNINSQNTIFSFTNTITEESKIAQSEIIDFEEAANYLLDRLELQNGFAVIKAIGHRIVHGMQCGILFK